MSPNLETKKQQLLFRAARMMARQIFFLAFLLTGSTFVAAQPVINSFSPSSATVGATITINGNNFNPVAANNIVYFGAVRANVVSATATTLTVTVPLRATSTYITVTTNSLTAYSTAPFNLVSGSNLSPTSYVMRWGFGVTGTYPSALAVGDLDGDGRPDLIGANFNTNNLSIFRSTSFSGTVQVVSEVKWPTGIRPEGLALGDVNSDGKPDMVITSIDDHLVSIFVNTSSPGSISFAPRMDIAAGPLYWPRGVAINDVDGDGKPDLVVADNNKIYSNNSSHGTVSIYRNTTANSTVSFAPAIVLDASEYTRKVCIADLDGDRKPDLAVTNNTTGSVSVFRNTSSPGSIAFSASQEYPTGSYPEQVVLGDLNSDGKADMAVSNYQSSTVSIFKNTSAAGSISFAAKQDISAVAPLGIAIGDLSGDGKPELVAASFSTGKVSVFTNASAGGTISFTPKMDYSSGDGPMQVSIGDMDGDLLPDIALTNSTINFITVIRGEAGPLSVNLGNDVALCQGDSLVLTANVPNVQYLWSTGAVANSITVKQSGNYWVKVTSGGSTASDTVQVTFNAKPSFDLGKDTSLCEGRSLVLKPAISGASYAWQDGSVADTMVVKTAGMYWLQLQKNGCGAADTISVSTRQGPPLNLGSDKVLCPDSGFLLNAYDPSIASYSWQDKSTQAQITVNKPGSYWVSVTGANGCFNYDTVQIINSSLTGFSLGKDTTLCDGSSLGYQFSLPGASYLWNTGAVANSFFITQPGDYWLQVAQDGCVKRDSITVGFVARPSVNLGNDTTLCEGATKVLDASNSNASYLWNTGATGSAITVSKKGVYWVEANRSGCVVGDTIRIDYNNLPRVSFDQDTVLCIGQTLVLKPQVSNGSPIWQDGSGGATYTVSQPGTYKINVSNQCGTVSREIRISSGVCGLMMPDAFTPNRDGRNDRFGVKYPGFIESFSMIIYDRWGGIVFQTRDALTGWDGTYKGRELPSGVYIWQISLTTKQGEKLSGKGTVMLLR
jgi:gliding motility-associated-like protein